MSADFAALSRLLDEPAPDQGPHPAEPPPHVDSGADPPPAASSRDQLDIFAP
jgi:hypothetical protein